MLPSLAVIHIVSVLSRTVVTFSYVSYEEKSQKMSSIRLLDVETYFVTELTPGQELDIIIIIVTRSVPRRTT